MNPNRLNPLNLLTRRRCEHRTLRCIHGDEIHARNGARSACLACGRTFPWLPAVCTVTAEPHPVPTDPPRPAEPNLDLLDNGP